MAGLSALSAIGTAVVLGFNGLFGTSEGTVEKSLQKDSAQKFYQPSGIWSDAPLGINITYCNYDSYGVDVVFETDLEPPYVVGVFMAVESGFYRRDYPIDYRIVNGKSCYISGDFLSKGYTFVQVFTESVTNSPDFRCLTPEEVDQRYRNFYSSGRGLDFKLERDEDEYWTEQYNSTNMVIFDDYQWGVYYPTMTNEIVVTANGRGFRYWRHVTNFVQTAEVKSGFLYSNDVSGVVREDINVRTNFFYEPYVTKDSYEVRKLSYRSVDGEVMYSVSGVRTFNDEHYAVTWEFIDRNYEPKVDPSRFAATNSFRRALVKHIGFFSNEVTGVVSDMQIASWTNEFIIADGPGVFRTEPEKTELRIGDKGYWYWMFETNILEDVIFDKRSAGSKDVVSGTVATGNKVMISIPGTRNYQNVEVTKGYFWSNIVTGATSEHVTNSTVKKLYDDLTYSMDAVDETLNPNQFFIIGETNRIWNGSGMRTLDDYHKRNTNLVQKALVVQQMIFTNEVPTIESIADKVVWFTNEMYPAGVQEDYLRIEPYRTYGDKTWYKIIGVKTLGGEHEADPSIVHTLEYTRGHVMSNETTGVVSEPIIEVYKSETVPEATVTNVFTITGKSQKFEFVHPQTNLYYAIYGESTSGSFGEKTEIRDIPVVVEFAPHVYEHLPEFMTNMYETVSRTFEFGPFDTSVGSGYRIIYIDNKDQFEVMRAYSVYTNRSQEVVLKHQFKSLSAHGGVRYGHDWMGRLVQIIDTNSVPDRIYWEGL